MIQHHTPLAAHIAILNAKAAAWRQKNPTGFHSGVIDDVKFWNEQGIFTPEQFERSGLENSVWEMYKDINGISPRWVNFADYSTEELQAWVDVLSAKIEKRIRKRKERAESFALESRDLDAWEKDNYEHNLKLEAMCQEANTLPAGLAEREEELFHLTH